MHNWLRYEPLDANGYSAFYVNPLCSWMDSVWANRLVIEYFTSGRFHWHVPFGSALQVQEDRLPPIDWVGMNYYGRCVRLLEACAAVHGSCWGMSWQQRCLLAWCHVSAWISAAKNCQPCRQHFQCVHAAGACMPKCYFSMLHMRYTGQEACSRHVHAFCHLPCLCLSGWQLTGSASRHAAQERQ